MENPGDLMPIKAFAAAAGRSQQAIYKQIGTRLASYVHEKDGQKYIERRALTEVFKIGVDGDIKPEQPQNNSTENNGEQPLYAVLQSTIETLQKQLEQKDIQLAAKDKQISDLTEILKDQAKSINAARHNELAGTMKQLLPENSESTVVVEDSADEEPPAEQPRRWKVFDWFRGK